MANILAAQNGNFNATATWIGGVVPGVGDVAYANTRTVTITANVTCDKLSTRGDNGATAGGGFTVAAGSTGLTITAAIEAGTTTCLISNLTSGQTLTVDASVGGVVGGTATNAIGANNASTGTLTITGNCTGGSAGSLSMGANNNSTGTLNITGNCTGGSGGSTPYGANNNSAGILTITGNCTGGSATNAHGASNASTGTLTITGNCTGGVGIGANNAAGGTLTITGIAYASSTSTAAGANNASTGTLRVTRAVGNAFGIGAVTVTPSPGVISANVQSLTYVQELEFGTRGATPTSGTIYLTGATSNVVDFALEGGGRKVLVDTNATAGVLPATSDVRLGTVYSTGNLTGTLAVPAAGSVALGVAVDNTTGTAVLTEANVRAAIGLASANLDTQLDALPTAAENATAVWGAATRTVTGGTVDTLTNAPSVPSAATIASQVRTELSTELGRIDATISSRLAPDGTLATVTTLTNAPDVPTPEEIAAEVWSTTEREITGGTVDTLTNSPDVPTEAEIASAVRDELEPELARMSNTATTQEVADIIEGALEPPAT